MSSFVEKSICVLGRQPDLGIAELESLYGAKHLRKVGTNSAALDIAAGEIDFDRLGGTIKLAKVLYRLPHDWPSIEQYLIKEIPLHIKHLPAGKFTLGLSVIDMDISADAINKSLLKVKKAIRSSSDRSVRIVPNKTSELNSAQVIHNKLTQPNGWELILVRDDSETILAQTIAIQDIEQYAARDQARPKRDARVGMLPPKLAQIIINLANPKPNATVLDPFCGTGVILQEALLMGRGAVGTDKDERMVSFTEANLDWLYAWRPDTNKAFHLEVADATNATWPKPIASVASETYLGRPLARLPQRDELNKIVQDVNTILGKFLKNLAPQLEKSARICLAVPAWQINTGQFLHLPLIDRLGDLGYNRVSFTTTANQALVYYRPEQLVARELIVLERID